MLHLSIILIAQFLRLSNAFYLPGLAPVTYCTASVEGNNYIICCESNKKFGVSQKPGITNNPVWTSEQLPMLRPLFGDIDFLEDQHILIAVKGAGDDHESYGECVISLKDMFTGEPCYFEATMTHFGEETGKLKGELYVSTGATGAFVSKSIRKTYEIVALDTEYHDPEDFIPLSPPCDLGHIGNLLTSPTSAFIAHPSEDDPKQPDIPCHYANHNLTRRAPSDPVPETPFEADPPPLPNKRGKMPLPGKVAERSSDGLLYTPNMASGVDQSQRSKPNGAAQILQPHHLLGKKPEPGSTTSPPPNSRQKVRSNMYPLLGLMKSDSESPPPLRNTQPVWQPRAEGEEFFPHLSPKPKLTPSAPPLPDSENIYPSIAIRPYEELKKPNTVQDWLKGLGLSEYISAFLRNGWDSMGSVHQLTAASVMKIGVRDAEHRMRILNSIRDLKGQST